MASVYSRLKAEKPRLVYWALQGVEIPTMTVSSMITSEYVRQTESAALDGRRVLCPPFVHLGTHPSAGLLLVSCLVLGCSVSSFVYRRQDKDPFQVPIFLGTILLAIALGLSAGASANLILLGWVPWAVQAAMIVSIVHHVQSEKQAKTRGNDLDEKSPLSD